MTVKTPMKVKTQLRIMYGVGVLAWVLFVVLLLLADTLTRFSVQALLCIGGFLIGVSHISMEEYYRARRALYGLGVRRGQSR